MIGRAGSGLAAFVLAIALGPSRPAPVPLHITVTIHHSRFVPDVIHVPARTEVQFTVVNGDPIDHEFLLGDEEAQRAHEDGTEPAHGHRPGEVSIPPYAERATTYWFGRPGDVLLGCHLPGHWDYGMRGVVVVR